MKDRSVMWISQVSFEATDSSLASAFSTQLMTGPEAIII